MRFAKISLSLLAALALGSCGNMPTGDVDTYCESCYRAVEQPPSAFLPNAKPGAPKQSAGGASRFHTPTEFFNV